MFNENPPSDTDAGGPLGPTLGPSLLGSWSPAVWLLVMWVCDIHSSGDTVWRDCPLPVPTTSPEAGSPGCRLLNGQGP